MRNSRRAQRRHRRDLKARDIDAAEKEKGGRIAGRPFAIPQHETIDGLFLRGWQALLHGLEVLVHFLEEVLEFIEALFGIGFFAAC
jgi:hypothetical protein